MLAAALQVLPLVRAALPAVESGVSVMAIVFRWAAGLATALGGVQAVSGASTVITSPLTASTPAGQAFTMRLTTAPNQAQYWTASGLPAGLSLSGQNGSTFWQIVGTPTVLGTFNVALTAYEQQGSNLKTSSTLVITVTSAGSPPMITGPPSSLTVTQGLSATFSVTATGTAPLTYQWRFQSANISGQTASSLVINPVAASNGGNYDVIVANGAGSVTSSVAVLTVVVPTPTVPVITVPPASLTVTQGQAASFSVTASGAAPLSYQWQFNGAPLSGQTGAGYSIAAASTNDAGNYDVVVANSLGSATSAVAVLTVTVPGTPQAPSILVEPSNQAIARGGTVTFSVVAAGTAPLRYQWYFDGEPIDGENGSSLTIAGVQATDVGVYSVRVRNSFGGVMSTGATLTMITGAGTYTGLYYDTSSFSSALAGSFTLVVTGNGGYSGVMRLLGQAYPFSGRIDSAGRSTNVVQRPSLNPMKLILQVDLTGADQVTGSVSDSYRTATVLGYRAVWNAVTFPCPQAGAYTLTIPGSASVSAPEGSGFGSIRVGPAGRIRISGLLADGTPFSQGSILSKAGQWPCFAGLYAGEGSIVGWLTFANRPTDDINGVLAWSKLQQPLDPMYPSGFMVTSSAIGSVYVRPVLGAAALNLNAGSLQLSGGNLQHSISRPVMQSINNQLTGPGGVHVSIAPRNGTFSGTVVDPSSGLVLSVRGVTFQKQSAAFGFFINGSRSGAVAIGP